MKASSKQLSNIHQPGDRDALVETGKLSRLSTSPQGYRFASIVSRGVASGTSYVLQAENEMPLLSIIMVDKS
jgi:hypothetical protein